MSYAVYKQLAPPSCVEHAVFAQLSGKSGNTSLLLARTSVLDVFDVDEACVSTCTAFHRAFETNVCGGSYGATNATVVAVWARVGTRDAVLRTAHPTCTRRRAAC